MIRKTQSNIMLNNCFTPTAFLIRLSIKFILMLTSGVLLAQSEIKSPVGVWKDQGSDFMIVFFNDGKVLRTFLDLNTKLKNNCIENLHSVGTWKTLSNGQIEVKTQGVLIEDKSKIEHEVKFSFYDDSLDTLYCEEHHFNLLRIAPEKLIK